MEAVLRKEVILNRRICRTCAVFVSVILITLGAFVRISLPFTPVPITLQTFFVLLSAGLLGRRLSLITQTSYIFLGVLGLPVFTGAASGLGYLISPTAGYLLGFILAAIFAAVSLKQVKNSLLKVLAVFCIASAMILLTGSLWLKVSFGISLTQSLLMGFAPFIFGDFLKALAATLAYLGFKNRVESVL